MTLVVVGVAVALVCVVWFVVGRSPEMAATHDPESLSDERRAGRDVAGPADAGAEGMAPPTAGQVGPGDKPEHQAG